MQKRIIFYLLVSALSCNVAEAAVLVFSGATYHAMTGYGTITTPDKEKFDTKAIYRLDYLGVDDNDCLVYDFSTQRFSIYKEITPYDLLTTNENYIIYDISVDTAIYRENTGLFDFNPTQDEINQVSSLIYVGSSRVFAPDKDGDMVNDTFDNCPSILNLWQTDSDKDGYGDSCDPELASDINFDNIVDLKDVILALQIAAGKSNQEQIFKAAAVNGSGTLGINDAINALICVMEPPPEEKSLETCTDGVDNDGDNHIDCRDFDCLGIGYCKAENTRTACSDGLDNDGDGFIDCDDLGCSSMSNCF